MSGTPPQSAILGRLPSAFAAACRLSRSDAELFERCREALVQRYQHEGIWLSVRSPSGVVSQLGSPERAGNTAEVIRLSSGQTEVVITADASLVPQLKAEAAPLALGLSVVLELRSVLQERQAALDDATFQLRALRQVARLLSSVHSRSETEQLILDFMAEVFFAWWACLYRVTDQGYEPHMVRALTDRLRPTTIDRAALDAALPPGSAVSHCGEVQVAQLVPPDTELVIPLDAGAERMAVLCLGPRISGQPYGRPEGELAGTLSFAAAIALKNADLVEELHSAATTDELTGLYNRRALEERLQAELSRAARHQLHTTIILMDLDRFKEVNDSLGHAAGDRLLLQMGEVLQRQCRSLDVVGRLGGDEFLVILPMTSPEEAMVFVGRLQTAVARLSAAHPEYGRVSLSLGLAESPQHGSSVSALLAAADAALYKAKRAGRDTVQVADI